MLAWYMCENGETDQNSTRCLFFRLYGKYGIGNRKKGWRPPWEDEGASTEAILRAARLAWGNKVLMTQVEYQMYNGEAKSFGEIESGLVRQLVSKANRSRRRP